MHEATNRVLILGLDGGSFDLMMPLMEAGLLPVLQKLKQTGAWGTLASTIPPTTPPAWTSSITGLNPGRHGIFDFTVSPLEDPSRPLISTHRIQGLKLWEIFNAADRNAIIVNLPVIYPPVPLKGIMISGMMTPSVDSEYTYPTHIKSHLKAVCGNYILNIDIARYDVLREKDALQFLDDIRESFDRRFEAVRHLMDSETWGVFMAVFIAMDRIQHLFVKYLIPGSHLYDTPIGRIIRDRIIREYAHIDAAIGELIEKAGVNTVTFIISDHGFGPTEAYFNVNLWLEQNGWLKLKSGPKLRKQLFQKAVEMSDGAVFRNVLPDSWHASIRKSIRKKRSSLLSPKSDLQDAIDWENTKAFFASIPSQGIFINEPVFSKNGRIDPEPIEILKRQIRDALFKLTDTTTGQPLAERVVFREDVFSGPQTVFAPHVLFKLKNYSFLGRQHLGASRIFTRCDDTPNGFHRDNGILLATGPGIGQGFIEDARITDITPTAVYAAGLPVPSGLDGRVLSGLFESQTASRPIMYSDYKTEHRADIDPGSDTYTEKDREIITERLKQLGYFE